MQSEFNLANSCKLTGHDQLEGTCHIPYPCHNLWMEADGKHPEDQRALSKIFGPAHFEDHVCHEGQANSYSQMEHHRVSEGKHFWEVNDQDNDEGGSYGGSCLWAEATMGVHDKERRKTLPTLQAKENEAYQLDVKPKSACSRVSH